MTLLRLSIHSNVGPISLSKDDSDMHEEKKSRQMDGSLYKEMEMLPRHCMKYDLE